VLRRLTQLEVVTRIAIKVLSDACPAMFIHRESKAYLACIRMQFKVKE